MNKSDSPVWRVARRLTSVVAATGLLAVFLVLAAPAASATSVVGKAAGPHISYLQFEVHGNHGFVSSVNLIAAPNSPGESVCNYSGWFRFNEPGGGNAEYTTYGTSGRDGCSFAPFISHDIDREFPLGTYVCGTFYVWDPDRPAAEQETPDGDQQAPEQCIKLGKGFW